MGFEIINLCALALIQTVKSIMKGDNVNNIDFIYQSSKVAVINQVLLFRIQFTGNAEIDSFIIDGESIECYHNQIYCKVKNYALFLRFIRDNYNDIISVEIMDVNCIELKRFMYSTINNGLEFYVDIKKLYRFVKLRIFENYIIVNDKKITVVEEKKDANGKIVVPSFPRDIFIQVNDEAVLTRFRTDYQVENHNIREVDTHAWLKRKFYGCEGLVFYQSYKYKFYQLIAKDPLIFRKTGAQRFSGWICAHKRKRDDDDHNQGKNVSNKKICK